MDRADAHCDGQGPLEMQMTKKVGALVLAAAFATGGLLAFQPAYAQQQAELSQKSVEKLLEYAWAITPDRFTKPNGVAVEIDRKNPKSVEVPMDTAREIIRVARISAHAQLCDLKEEHAINFRTLMGREAIKKKWTEQQMVYMNQLHMVTVMLLTGQLKVIESEIKDGKEVQVAEEDGKPRASCPPEQKAKVKEALAAYQKAGPVLEPQAAAGGPAPSLPAPAATPASAPAKK